MQIYGRISIHAPREGGDPGNAAAAMKLTVFQSTPPRGGGRLQQCLQPPVRPVISIHAPREGGDRPYLRLGLGEGISIHAPARGATWTSAARMTCLRHFNPRPPRGGRPHKEVT